MSLNIACPGCGHDFYNEWELIQHTNGRHHYRAWTPEDGRRLAGEATERESMWKLLRVSGGKASR